MPDTSVYDALVQGVATALGALAGYWGAVAIDRRAANRTEASAAEEQRAQLDASVQLIKHSIGYNQYLALEIARAVEQGQVHMAPLFDTSAWDECRVFLVRSFHDAKTQTALASFFAKSRGLGSLAEAYQRACLGVGDQRENYRPGLAALLLMRANDLASDAEVALAALNTLERVATSSVFSSPGSPS